MQHKAFIHPFNIFFLLVPSGISQGFVSVTLPYLFTQKGFPVQLSAGIVAFGLSANIWRFLWGPIADATLSLKKWYLIGLASTIITLIALCILPYNSRQTANLFLLVFLSQVAATLTVLPVSGIMAHRIKDEKKGLASGWFQAGNLGGTGIGGGLGLWLATHYNITIAAIVISIMMLFCCLPLYAITDIAVNKTVSFFKQTKEVFSDLIAMIKTPLTLFVIVLVISPIGSGAVSYLWSAVGNEWHADADTIALSTGIVSGLCSALGSIAGGWICDKWNVFTGYFFAGALCALVTIIMALCSYTPLVFVACVLAYAFAVGLCYDAFSATLLFAIGKKSAATRYSVLASLGNVSVVYMTALDGKVHDAYNTKAMLLFESFAALIFVGLYIWVVKWMRGRGWIVKS